MVELDTEIENLESDGYRIVDVIAGDIKVTKELQYIVDRIIEQNRGTFYTDLLYRLTGERFLEPEAKQLWQEILQHKYIMSEKFGRNVGIRVSALDYLENIKKLIQMPKIIEESEFRKTVKFAAIDPLTQLYNRRVFIERVSRQITNCKQSPDKCEIFSVFLLDLDGFKGFNDSEGHNAGDLLLQEFAKLLISSVRKEDLIGRYGGDEFTVLLNRTDKFGAKKVGEKIREQVRTEFKQINITVSMGIAEFPADGKTFYELISNADELLYRVKEFGGNKVAYLKDIGIRYKQDGERAGSVSCVGDFNRWNKQYGRMRFDEQRKEWIFDGKFKPGRYRYKFVINGTKWIADPNSKENVDDGFGGKCSILTAGFE